ncbi:AidA/PixA family protein [Trinickia caryophylli]|uniref:Inclusion body protein n=1 Tax=Trinickia caryophylli TaxID=28094 RepID=A0A1X7GJW2_TRICW|nr:AidA/PixA family protein [Trinickia caryophylli]PMS09135.1 hypothetical protein C0Z17_26410 [Trinickia caryophylli]TRX14976.1 hypothetical protein FNF07_27610 [Trinickia caryophylli]WQE14832.1 AidA/PixA family protein [Trinickia caryophylli]SMF70885.1 Inclusion body protein [Trinickia caryophylli]GLU35036.1 hypothetical protein Busp01_48780 [Trinickia caryophylli]
MAVRDVLIVVDAQRIVQSYGRNDAGRTGEYVPLGQGGEGQGFVYMFATYSDARGEGSSELDIGANAGDTIRWRMASISEGNNYSCFMTHFVFTGPANYSEFITEPQQKYETIKTLQIDKKAPMLRGVVPIERDDFYWEATMIKPGRLVYHTKFLVFCSDGGGTTTGGGGGNNDPYGGYQWDPFID